MMYSTLRPRLPEDEHTQLHDNMVRTVQLMSTPGTASFEKHLRDYICSQFMSSVTVRLDPLTVFLSLCGSGLPLPDVDSTMVGFPVPDKNLLGIPHFPIMIFVCGAVYWRLALVQRSLRGSRLRLQGCLSLDTQRARDTAL